jgi:hypothetical protein
MFGGTVLVELGGGGGGVKTKIYRQKRPVAKFKKAPPYW